MSTPDSILIIGGGQMGGALARGFVASGIAASSITLIEPSDSKRSDFSSSGFAVASALTSLDATHTPQVTVLAIKPQGFAELAPALSAFYRARAPHLFLSILAGTTLASLRDTLGADAPIVRVMPNTPALIGEGISACVASDSVSSAQRSHASSLLATVGEVVWLTNESQLDVATAVSGSGPAYMFHLLECLVAAGVAHGLPEDAARHLAIATMRGASGLAESSTGSLASLRENVTSPGGTTQAALAVLMPTLGGLIEATVEAAIARAKQLG